MPSEFDRMVHEHVGAELHAQSIDTVQVNLGLCCNQSCAHCHLEASPDRRESMDWPTMELIVEGVAQVDHPLVDLTGGAPELNTHLRRLIGALRHAGCPVQMRTNLTVLLQPGLAALPEFLRDHEVRLVGSLPCYLEENVRAQRGAGAYERSIEAIHRLNALGYGLDSSLPLDLVYNPGGPFLAPDQAELEHDYRRELGSRFGIAFSRLLTITNMPLGRFLTTLERDRQDEAYWGLLRESFNPETLGRLMCRRQICIRWDGTLYDCDFNLALGLAVEGATSLHVRTFDPAALATRRIATGEHCLGCTAGAGSSCQGALA